MQTDMTCRPLGRLANTSAQSASRWKRGLVRIGSEMDKKFCNAIEKLERDQRQLENLAVVGRRTVGAP